MNRTKRVYCPMCEQERECRRENRSETYQVRGEAILLEVPRDICMSCGEAVVDESFGDPSEKLYAEYRRRHGLLTPGEIKAIRDKYELSQEAMAVLLGSSPATLNRYEGGSIQDPINDSAIRAFDDPAFVRDCLRRKGSVLSERQRAKLLAVLDRLDDLPNRAARRAVHG